MTDTRIRGMDLRHLFAVDDLAAIKKHFGLFKKPGEMEMIDAINHNAHACIDFMSKRFFCKRTFVSTGFIQAAAAANRVDILRRLRLSQSWNIYSPAIGLDAINCGLEAAHFLLDQWDQTDSNIVQQWQANTIPFESPLESHLEDGPFTAARLVAQPELFNRLMRICQNHPNVCDVVRQQLLETTRSKYSHLNFDNIFLHQISDVLFVKDEYCLNITKKSLEGTFPSKISDLLKKPQFENVIAQNFDQLCLISFLSFSHIREDVFWQQTKTLSDFNPMRCAQVWAKMCTKSSNELSENKLHELFVDYNPHALDALIAHASSDFEWDSTSVVGAAVMRHKLKNAVVDQGTTPLKRKI